ncbi:hypothetical protein T439DRAFT_380825 [Meredithblackwellia eburnea MCA 4105]
MVDIASPQKKPVRTYGKRSLSSSASQPTRVNPSSINYNASEDDDSSSDSDDQISKRLIGDLKGKGRSVAGNGMGMSSPVFSLNRGIGGPVAAVSRRTGGTGGATAVSVRPPPTKTATTSSTLASTSINKKKASENTTAEDTTDWDQPSLSSTSTSISLVARMARRSPTKARPQPPTSTLVEREAKDSSLPQPPSKRRKSSPELLRASPESSTRTQPGARRIVSAPLRNNITTASQLENHQQTPQSSSSPGVKRRGAPGVWEGEGRGRMSSPPDGYESPPRSTVRVRKVRKVAEEEELEKTEVEEEEENEAAETKMREPGKRTAVAHSAKDNWRGKRQEGPYVLVKPSKATLNLHSPTSKLSDLNPTRHSPSPALSQSPTPSPASPIKSPLKDLSKVFERFSATPSASGSREGSTKSSGKALGKTTSLVSAMGGRSANSGADAAKGHEFLSPHSNPLSRAHSQPALSSPSRSPRPLIPSSSLPVNFLDPSSPQTQPQLHTQHRPLVRNPTSSITFDPNGVGLAPRGTGGVRKTYGGARSFKKDKEGDDFFGGVGGAPSSSSSMGAGPGKKRTLLPTFPSLTAQRETYSSLRAKYGLDEEEDLVEELELSSQLKSVNQMRSKGDNNRFVDEFNYLMEGLEGGMDLGVRRSSAAAVLEKILDPEFVRRLKSLGLVERVYGDFRKAEAGDGDRALDPSLALLLSLISQDQRNTEPLLLIRSSEYSHSSENEADIYEKHKSDVLVRLKEMLGRPWAGEPLAEEGKVVGKGKGVSKADARAAESIKTLVDKSEILKPFAAPPTMKQLCLSALSTISTFTPRAIFRPQEMMCITGAFEAVIDTFVQDAKILPLRMSRYETGLNFLPADHSVNLPQLDVCLRIIESCSRAEPLTQEILSSRMASLAPALIDILLACHIVLGGKDLSQSTSAAAMDLLLSTLRLVIDLTTNDPEWSLAFANCDLAIPILVKLLASSRNLKVQPTPTVVVVSPLLSSEDDVSAPIEEQKSSPPGQFNFDVLCLVLGVLANLVETVPEVKDVLRETELDPNCPGASKCARHCVCDNRETAIFRFTELYLDPLADSTNEVNTSFVNGYSGILLGIVMLDTPLNQDLVVNGLRNKEDALGKLLAAMEEFAGVHEEADREEESQATTEVDLGNESQESRRSGGENERRNMAGRIRSMVLELRDRL